MTKDSGHLSSRTTPERSPKQTIRAASCAKKPRVLTEEYPSYLWGAAPAVIAPRLLILWCDRGGSIEVNVRPESEAR